MINKHYSEWAEKASHSWVFSRRYFSFWARTVVSELPRGLSPVRICDVGAGDGSLAEALVDESSAISKIDCVEPFVEPGPKKMTRRISFYREEFHSFLAQAHAKYGCFVFKQCLHHLDRSTWNGLFLQVRDRLESGGCILVLTMPPMIEYPIFEKAQSAFRRSQLSRSCVVEALESVGMRVSERPVDYKEMMEKDRFYNAIRGRHISDLRDLSDEEIEMGIREIEAEFLKGKDAFELVDRLWLIKGTDVS